jgi:UDP-glucose 4-epimerase
MDLSPDRLLVTGGAGFLGRHLSRRYADAGWQVTVLDDLSCPNSTFGCPELRHPAIHTVHGSIFDAALVARLVTEHPVVVHFASVVGVGKTIEEPVETARNLAGTLNLVDSLTADHTVLFGSSADVYGMHSRRHGQRMAEDDEVVFEHAAVNRWVYPKVKSLEENVLAASPARAAIVRIFNSYGPGMDYPQPKRVVPAFLEALERGEPMLLSGDGGQVRCFCWHDDTVHGLGLALEHARRSAAGSAMTVNVGSDVPVTIAELAALMNEVAVETGFRRRPVPVERADGEMYAQPFCDSWHRIPDLTRARTMLGYAPTVDLRDGMARLFRAHRERIAPAAARRTPALR